VKVDCGLNLEWEFGLFVLLFRGCGVRFVWILRFQ